MIFFRAGRLARPASSPNLRPQSPSRPSLLRHHARVTRDLLDGWESARVQTRCWVFKSSIYPVGGEGPGNILKRN